MRVLSVCLFLFSAEPSESAELTRTARLDTIERVALSHNQGPAESGERSLAAEARARAAGRRPEPELKYEQWGVPLDRPVALNQADTLMLGLRQSFPAWGSREARGRAAMEEAGQARDAEQLRRLDLADQVERAFVDYYRADQELALHREQVALTTRLLELSRLRSLRDTLRFQLELTRLHLDVIRLERDRRTSASSLNALMDREPDAPLGPPEAPTLEPASEAVRPELTSAARAVRRSEAVLEATRRAAHLPALMVGLDYWYRPNVQVHHAYGAMVAMTLPWLSGGDQVREAEHEVRADQHALAATRTMVRQEQHQALLRLAAAREAVASIDGALSSQARRSVEAMRATYAAGQGDTLDLLDALRSDLEVQIEGVRAHAELVASQAQVRRVQGGRP